MVTRSGGVKKNPPLHAILQPRHPGVHFLNSREARKQEKYWQSNCNFALNQVG